MYKFILSAIVVLTNYVFNCVNTFAEWLVEAVGLKKFAGRVVTIV